jgi:hypothetical protein
MTKNINTIRIFQSGGITTFYQVRDLTTGNTLYTSHPIWPSTGALQTKIWCLKNGYGWPTQAQMNG